MSMNFKEVEKYLPMIFKTKLRPCLLGHTGIGKTEFFQQVTAKHNMDLIVIHVAQLEPSDFVGLYQINESGRTSNCPPAWLPYADGVGRTVELTPTSKEELAESLRSLGYNPNGGIVFLDEVNRAHEDMRQALYQFLQDGKIHTYSLPKGDATKTNSMGLPMGKYHVACAANPSSEGYETQEFDPALMNRISWVNFRPSIDETQDYLKNKYGRNPVLSWVESNKDLIDFGSEFKIDGLRYSPRMEENHIILYNECRKEPKDFRRKIFETIMPKEKVIAFMAYLEELEFVNYKHILQGVKGKEEEKLKKIVKNNHLDVLSTITNDLAEFWNGFAIGQDNSDLFDDVGEAVTRTLDYLDMSTDEQICSFMDGMKATWGTPTAITSSKAFRDRFKGRLSKYRSVLEPRS